MDNFLDVDDDNDVEITTKNKRINDIFIVTIDKDNDEPDPAILDSKIYEKSKLSQVGLAWKMVEFELTIVLQNGRKHSRRRLRS